MPSVQHVYQDLWTNPISYRKAKLLCRQLFLRHLKKYRQTNSWHPWFKHRFEDCKHVCRAFEKRRDRNVAIYSIVSDARKRGISIQVFPPSSPSVWVTAYVERFGQEVLDKPIEHLTLVCELSKEAIEVVGSLLDVWIDRSNSYLRAKALIDKMLKTR